MFKIVGDMHGQMVTQAPTMFIRPIMESDHVQSTICRATAVVDTAHRLPPTFSWASVEWYWDPRSWNSSWNLPTPRNTSLIGSVKPSQKHENHFLLIIPNLFFLTLHQQHLNNINMTYVTLNICSHPLRMSFNVTWSSGPTKPIWICRSLSDSTFTTTVGRRQDGIHGLPGLVNLQKNDGQIHHF